MDYEDMLLSPTKTVCSLAPSEEEALLRMDIGEDEPGIPPMGGSPSGSVPSPGQIVRPKTARSGNSKLSGPSGVPSIPELQVSGVNLRTWALVESPPPWPAARNLG